YKPPPFSTVNHRSSRQATGRRSPSLNQRRSACMYKPPSVFNRQPP
ncbi:hypothetical protein A2U01_0028774, partial [Trifolium medium]|nr:hypothetical protein [Trifolium medium]